MKTAFLVLLLLALGVFSIVHVCQPILALHFGVNSSLDKKDFYQASQQCKRILALKPSLFEEEAASRIGDIAIAAAESELQKPDPDFSLASDWLSELIKRDGPSTCSEERARHLLKRIPELHYAHAHQLFLHNDYDRALAEFGEIQRLYEGDPIQSRIKTEAYTTEVEAAVAQSKSGDPEAALDRFAKLSQATHLPPVMVARALAAVPGLAEQAIRARIGRGEFAYAFDFMERMDSRFAEPETTARLKELRAKIDLELFGKTLDSGPYIEAAHQKPTEPPFHNDDEKAVLVVRNDTISPMRLIYVGPRRAEIEVPLHGERRIALAPGHYLAAVYWPTNHNLRAKREECVLNAGVYEKFFGMALERMGGLLLTQNPL
jgi:hypothetical protein